MVTSKKADLVTLKVVWILCHIMTTRPFQEASKWWMGQTEVAGTFTLKGHTGLLIAIRKKTCFRAHSL